MANQLYSWNRVTGVRACRVPLFDQYIFRLTYRSCLLYQANMATKMAKLGELLADARARRKLTLRAVQEAVGISNAYLSQLETAKVQSPSPVVLHKLSELYELPYETVMEAAGYPAARPSQIDGPAERLSARIGKTTPEEEDALVEYLRFIRSQRTRRGHP
jgi:HTH-type transcriptional regulator, competence development regulator